jgi:hypothetical protein
MIDMGLAAGPAAVLAELARLNIQIRVRDGRIQCRPVGALPPELRAALAEHKVGILGILSATPPAAPPPAPAESAPAPPPPGGEQTVDASDDQWLSADGGCPPLPPLVVRLARKRRGWTPTMQLEYLLELADACAELHPERAYAARLAAVALRPAWRAEYEERAAVMECDGGLLRPAAERAALAEVLALRRVVGIPLMKRESLLTHDSLWMTIITYEYEHADELEGDREHEDHDRPVARRAA